ncbi:selenoprotein S-like [Macrobrachium rosenbergii]|uniref:selenoprotein S-like n=1 Tax=Macrobrachium rosenbergii TaxID=79674 RepID=UPI0034D42F55
MGDVEQLIAEPEEGDFNQDVDGLHPSSLNQQNPWFISQVITSITSTIEANGWYILGLLILLYIVKINLQPKISAWRRKREEAEELAAVHKDPDRYLERELALDKARQKLQQQYNQNAEQWIEKQKELEEKKRREKVEDWERHERGEGYRNKSRNTASAAAAPASNASSATGDKKSGKPKLRPEYNPMTGDIGGGSCRWRPDRPGPSGGG